MATLSPVKTCSKCKLKLEQLEQFHKDKRNKDGYRSQCKACTKITKKRHYEENKEKIIEKNSEYQKKNKKSIIEYKRNYEKNRRLTDEGFRIKDNLRARLYIALKGNNKSASTLQLLGCSIEFLRNYLENTKVEGKDYSNAHIDHIRPCASFDLTDPEQQRECFHYTNLQWLPAKENLSKGAKWDHDY